MATSNDPGLPKKPTPPPQQPPVANKPAVPPAGAPRIPVPGAKPAVPGQTPPPRAQTPGQVPAKPPAPAGAKPPLSQAPPAKAPVPGQAPPAKAPIPGQAPPAKAPVPGQAPPPRAQTPGQVPAKPPLPPGAKPPLPAGAKPPLATNGAAAAKPAVPPAKPAVPGAKPPLAPGAKPPVAAAPGAKPPAPAPGAKPPAGKPPAPGGKPAISSSKMKPAPVKAEMVGRTAGRRLGQVLIDLGYVDEDQLWELLEESKSNGAMLGQTAIARGLITETQLQQGLAEQFGLKLLSNDELKPTAEALALVPETMATVYKILPLTVQAGVLQVAVGDPACLSSLDDLRNLLGLQGIEASLGTPTAVAEALAKCYQGQEESIVDLIKSLQDDDDAGGDRGREGSIDLESLMEMQDAAPVRKLLNMVMLLAIKDRASDIHFEPFEEEYKLRYRCDGVMYEMVPPPRHLAMAISTRIKVMANLDIAERRLPQDGRIELNVGGNQVDMRVSILPTMFGEACVIRVLDRGNVGLDLNRIGMEKHILDKFREMIKKPNGIVLVTGPTGSGKTTTLYSALSELNEITDKLITTEDPIEYDIDGIIQVPINADIGVTFAAALRAILRQDPDRILVGEIRDLETAQIAVQSALTGHMVFSTLHTNDAPSTITRMRDMGLETYLLTATLEGILAQRLVRKICEDCRTEFEPSPEIVMELNLRPDELVGKKFYYGKGCERCNNSGHKGRMGLYELVVMNDELRDLISAGASTDQLRNACRKQGMSTLRDAGLNAIFAGHTTIDEVVKETITEDE
jgi:type IV pilus assembly protein PilB